MASPADDHDHNGFYVRVPECKLMRQNLTTKIDGNSENNHDLKSEMRRLQWTIIGGFIANGSVIIFGLVKILAGSAQ